MTPANFSITSFCPRFRLHFAGIIIFLDFPGSRSEMMRVASRYIVSTFLLFSSSIHYIIYYKYGNKLGSFKFYMFQKQSFSRRKTLVELWFPSLFFAIIFVYCSYYFTCTEYKHYSDLDMARNVNCYLNIIWLNIDSIL